MEVVKLRCRKGLATLRQILGYQAEEAGLKGVRRDLPRRSASAKIKTPQHDNLWQNRVEPNKLVFPIIPFIPCMAFLDSPFPWVAGINKKYVGARKFVDRVPILHEKHRIMIHRPPCLPSLFPEIPSTKCSRPSPQ